LIQILVIHHEYFAQSQFEHTIVLRVGTLEGPEEEELVTVEELGAQGLREQIQAVHELASQVVLGAVELLESGVVFSRPAALEEVHSYVFAVLGQLGPQILQNYCAFFSPQGQIVDKSCPENLSIEFLVLV